jgi:type IV secretory pathway VirD2 relaxase
MTTHFVHPKLRTWRVWNHRQTQQGAEFGLATSTRDAQRLRHSQANQTILRGQGTRGLFKKATFRVLTMRETQNAFAPSFRNAPRDDSLIAHA